MGTTIHRLRRVQLGNGTAEGRQGEAERSAMICAAAEKLAELFDILQIDHLDDHNTRDTPGYVAPPRITDFDNAQAFDQLIVTGPIELRSTCAHHMMPIYGHAFVGALPSADGRII